VAGHYRGRSAHIILSLYSLTADFIPGSSGQYTPTETNTLVAEIAVRTAHRETVNEIDKPYPHLCHEDNRGQAKVWLAEVWLDGSNWYNNRLTSRRYGSLSLSSTSPFYSAGMAAYWKGNLKNTQKPSRKDPINAPTTPEDGAWTLMDTDDRLPPPTYPDVGPQPGPARTSAPPSTNGVIFYLTSFREGK
jgi:hypothetical protein